MPCLSEVVEKPSKEEAIAAHGSRRPKHHYFINLLPSFVVPASDNKYKIVPCASIVK